MFRVTAVQYLRLCHINKPFLFQKMATLNYQHTFPECVPTAPTLTLPVVAATAAALLHYWASWRRLFYGIDIPGAPWTGSHTSCWIGFSGLLSHEDWIRYAGSDFFIAASSLQIQSQIFSCCMLAHLCLLQKDQSALHELMIWSYRLEYSPIFLLISRDLRRRKRTNSAVETDTWQ